MLSRQEGSTRRHLGNALVLRTGQPVETQDVFFWRLAGRSAPTGLANCPLDRVLTYKNLIYLLKFDRFMDRELELWNHKEITTTLTVSGTVRTRWVCGQGFDILSLLTNLK